MSFAQRGRCVVTRLLQPTDPVAQPFRSRRVASDRGQPHATAAGVEMAPPPGQTNRDTSAADHTTCFYCHQQLILVSHKVIVSRDAHGCSIRICEPCEKEARRRRPVRLLRKRSRRRRADDRSRHRGVPVVRRFAIRHDPYPHHLRRRSRSRRKMRVLRLCASSWAVPPTRMRRRVLSPCCPRSALNSALTGIRAPIRHRPEC